MGKWNNKVVVVTGGSQGLGFEIAAAFASAGATTIIAARNVNQLDAAVEKAKSSGRNLDSVVCDVTNDQSVTTAVAEIVARHEKIDVWVNNVGKSARVRFEDCTVAQYQNLMDLNFYSAVRCTLSALGPLTQTSGIVVNIGSLASKTAWRNVAPYAASKHALAAFSHQFRLEGPSNVDCLFVCPGPIQRLDSATRYDQEAQGLSDAARQPGAGVKLKGIPPAKLAMKIIRCCELRKRELVYPWKARVVFAIAQISPRIGDYLLRMFSNKK